MRKTKKQFKRKYLKYIKYLAIIPVLLIIILLVLRGCSNEETETVISYNLNEGFFNVITPYQRGVAENYIPVRTGNRVDLDATELGLMRIATKYYDVNNHLFSPGQFLDREAIDNIIKEVNEDKPYVSYLVEQNYFTKNNRLVGVVIGVVINPFQGDQTLTNDEIHELITQFSSVIISELRNNDELTNTEIVLAAFRMQPNTSLVPGTYIFEERTNSDEINEFILVNEEYYVLTDTNLPNIDQRTFNSFANIRADLETEFPNAVITGTGLYHNQELQDLRIDVNVGFIRPHQVIAMSNHLITEFNRYFSRDINTVIILNNDRSTMAIITINNRTRGNIDLLI